MVDIPADPRFRFIAEVMQALTSTNQQEKVLSLIVDRVVRVYHAQTCAIVLIDPKTEYLAIDNCHGLSLTFCNAFRRTIATSAVGRLLWTGKTILVEDSREQQDIASEVKLEHPFGSCAAVPLIVDQRPLGYLYVDATDAGAFREPDLQVLRLFADIAGLAITKARLFEENLHLERIDRETGLEKYVPFLEKLEVAISRAIEFHEPLSIMILDVDNFKQVVNTYGFDRSRELLKAMAELFKDHVRAVDAAGRYGFDEFILMLVNTTLEGALERAGAIVRDIASKEFTGAVIRSSVSAGVAAYPQNGLSTEDLLTAARRAVFEAQRKGRNTVFHFEKAWYAADST